MARRKRRLLYRDFRAPATNPSWYFSDITCSSRRGGEKEKSNHVTNTERGVDVTVEKNGGSPTLRAYRGLLWRAPSLLIDARSKICAGWKRSVIHSTRKADLRKGAIFDHLCLRAVVTKTFQVLAPLWYTGTLRSSSPRHPKQIVSHKFYFLKE
ncbi:hypothetical protein CEXT_84231 [Caerostris extrusa]|uniref:Uncharacterized protein n=1 Tax=Caerostris extrusa TaxID=172846 RepID=A0AAV4MSM4_CAEEX|nr:hypothetical protein CEXT_84231 [Caerostris extrusa]